MADTNNIDMLSANEDVLLRSDGATPAVGRNVQHSQQSETNATSQFLRSLVEHPQPTRTNDTSEENRSGRQLRLTRRERDHHTRSHRDQLSTTHYIIRQDFVILLLHHIDIIIDTWNTIHLLLVTVRMNGHVDQNQGVSITMRMTSIEDKS